MKKGWEKKTLKETAKVIGGYSFRSSEFKKSGKYQVIRMGNVRPGTIRPDENPVFIDSLDEKILNRAQLLPNDVIITQTGTKKKRDYGYTAIVDSDNYLLNQRIAAIRFSDYYLPKFFLYYSWTNFFKDQYFSNETGTVGQGNVGINAITDALVPFCKLTEQKRIVKILDEAFAAIDKAKANAEKNLKNAKELFESLCNKELWLQNINSPQKVLSEIVDNNRGGVKIGPFGSALKIGELVDKGNIRVLYIENIVNNKFDWKKEKYITTEKFNELKNYEVFSGDVLITIMGTIGRTAIVPENLGKSIISSHLIKITPNQKLITSEYLNYSLNSNPFVVQQLYGQAKGSIMKGINSTIIKNLLITIPFIKEQILIVKKLDALSAETKKLEAIYQMKIEDLEKLKKSILQKAFDGQL